MDEKIGELAVRVVSEGLTATGHDAAGRAMLRTAQRMALPFSDGRLHVYLACSAYDANLLGALSPSTGGRSRALDDAYRRVYGYTALPFTFHFIVLDDEDARLSLAS